MAQPPFPEYQPQSQTSKQRRGPLMLAGVLVLVLIAVVAVGIVVVLKASDDKPKAVATTPSTPQAVEFRRVLKFAPGTCASPAPQGIFCDAKGIRYTLGTVELDGSHVSEVKAAHDDSGDGSWYVGLTLDQEGTRIFGQLTTALASQPLPANQLAIVVGNEVATAPTVNSPITAGKIQISASYTKSDAEALAAKIIG